VQIFENVDWCIKSISSVPSKLKVDKKFLKKKITIDSFPETEKFVEAQSVETNLQKRMKQCIKGYILAFCMASV